MVDVEFSMEAKEDMMAAANAASTKPFNPVGINVFINQGYALSLFNAVELAISNAC